MAIDTSMFALNLPAGSYAVGDTIPMKSIRGPAIVRDGYGTAILKRIICGLSRGASGSVIRGHVVVKNSNWVDEVSNIAAPMGQTSLAENSSNINRGHDCKLVPNSGWDVKFVVDVAVTTTVDNDLFCLLDIDYPSVQAVQNPRTAPGTPVTIMRNDAVTTSLSGAIESATWTTVNVDFLKAGFKYLLTEVGTYNYAGYLGFVSISQAAGQQGLERIIPTIPMDPSNMRYLLDYSTPLVKGPMNLNYMVLAGSVTSINIVTEIDWVKA